MELSASVLKGLQVAGSSAVGDGAFSKLASRVLQATLGLGDASSVQGDPALSKVDSGMLKEAYAALMTFVAEAARTDTDETGVSTVLEDCKFSPDRIETLSTLYMEHKAKVRAVLGRVLTAHPHIVDVDWRLDYYLKNNHLDRVNQPVYLIDLKTEQGDKGNRIVQFACSHEQLEDLVTKLKDACKSLEKFGQK